MRDAFAGWYSDFVMHSTGATYHSSGEKADIWLVEDNALFRETIADLLNDSPDLHCAMCFASCEEALTALESDLLPDVILMDIGLPGISGIEGVSRIKALTPAVPVIMLTVHHDNERIFQAICAGASGYLLKTAQPQEIIDAVEKVRRGGAPIDAQIARRVLEMFTHLAAPRADYSLSDREHEILHHLVEGRPKKQIAEVLFLSPHTIDGHIRNIYAKLQVHTRTGAVAKALRENLI